eukprot:CAMPEP_0170083458 /NCGR_PEP_ID=MMETSP0019_2-20121128/18849_1 /TAXON_ID=98059 /ORGANISM="Dinobryon sp., Strain UTEXLB2267" /LENGTH=460 /DNA_ID=CAMNT_0010298955 /DNA_START=242 /DNA_END=1623 /DNA_ORIENTATION=-
MLVIIASRANSNLDPPRFVAPIRDLPPRFLSWDEKPSEKRLKALNPPVNIIGCNHSLELILAKADWRARQVHRVNETKIERIEQKLKQLDSEINFKNGRAARYAALVELQQKQVAWLRTVSVLAILNTLHERYQSKRAILIKMQHDTYLALTIKRVVLRWYNYRIYKKYTAALSVQQREQFPLPSENSPQEQGRIAHRSLHARLPAQLRQDQECHPPLPASGAYSAALYPRLPGDEEGAARGAESAVAGCGVGLPPQSTQAAPREAQAARDCDDGRPEPAGPALQGDHDQAGLQVGAHGRQGRGHRGQAAGQEGVGQRQRGGRDPQVPAAWGREKGPDGAHVQKDFYKRQSAAPLTSKAGKHVRSFNEADAFDMLMGRNIDRIYSSISGVSAGESVQDLLVRDAQDPLGSQVRQKRPSKVRSKRGPFRVFSTFSQPEVRSALLAVIREAHEKLQHVEQFS